MSERVGIDPLMCTLMHLHMFASLSNQVMTRFVSIDFIGNSDTGYPGVETGEAWNVYTHADANDNRDNADSKQVIAVGDVISQSYEQSQKSLLIRIRIEQRWQVQSNWIWLLQSVIAVLCMLSCMLGCSTPCDSATVCVFQWLLCPGQVMRFKSLASFGDKPGTLSAHTLCDGILYNTRQPYTRSAH